MYFWQNKNGLFKFGALWVPYWCDWIVPRAAFCERRHVQLIFHFHFSLYINWCFHVLVTAQRLNYSKGRTGFWESCVEFLSECKLYIRHLNPTKIMWISIIIKQLLICVLILGNVSLNLYKNIKPASENSKWNQSIRLEPHKCLGSNISLICFAFP
jgi:hypothetical protein